MDPTLDKIKLGKISQNLDEIAIFARIAEKKTKKTLQSKPPPGTELSNGVFIRTRG